MNERHPATAQTLAAAPPATTVGPGLPARSAANLPCDIAPAGPAAAPPGGPAASGPVPPVRDAAVARDAAVPRNAAIPPLEEMSWSEWAVRVGAMRPRLHGYELIRPLDEGGMGVVWRAQPIGH